MSNTSKSARRAEKTAKQGDALKRMDEALKAALKMAPRKHKDEPKRPRRDKEKK